MHLPLALGAVVPVVNVPGLSHAVRLTSEVLAAMLLGEITAWNDPRLLALNPRLELPNLPITVVHRSDDSGTTFALSDYLAQVSPRWASKVGKGSIVTWPIGAAVKGSEGEYRAVQATPGALGYVELAYAQKYRLATAELQNAAGKFVKASADSVAAATVGNVPSDFRFSLANSKAEQAWPICTMTWALVDEDLPAGPSRDGAHPLPALGDPRGTDVLRGPGLRAAPPPS